MSSPDFTPGNDDIQNFTPVRLAFLLDLLNSYAVSANSKVLIAKEKLMPHPRISSEDIQRRGNEIYETVLRARVETPENIGKQIVIDVGTGDYEIGDNGLAISNTVLARHPGAALLGLRIGYNAVYAIGGVLTRMAKPA